MALIGDFFKTYPDIPKIKPVNLEAEQQAAIKANQAALPGATALAGSTNQANLDQWLKGIKFAMPEFEEQRKLISGNITSMLRGEVPLEDRNMQLLQDTAWAYGSGVSGSGLEAGKKARNFGLQMMEQQQKGQNAMQSWMSALKTPAQMDVTSMFISPQERIGYQFKEREDTFQRDYLKNTISAQETFGSRMAASEDSLMEML